MTGGSDRSPGTSEILIRSIDLPSGSQGIPAVYEVNGREYIAICAAGANVSGGGAGGGEKKMETHACVAFALPAK